MQTHAEMTPLSGWVTIAEVSDALHVKYDTIKHAVERADALQQNWVKQESYPVPGCSLRWLLDTSHPAYQYHEQRWRKLAEKTEAKQMAGFLDDRAPDEEDEESDGTVFEEPDVFVFDDEEMDALPFYSPSETQRPALDETAAWSELSHWLAQLGLVVFVNAIDPDQGWHWSWRNHAGAGYPDATAAVIAALRYQLVLGSPLLPSPSSSPEPDPFFWKKLLSGKWSRKPTPLEQERKGFHERS